MIKIVRDAKAQERSLTHFNQKSNAIRVEAQERYEIL